MSHASAESVGEILNHVWTIVVAGGSGIRFGERKQFLDLGGRTVLQRSVDVASSVSSGVVVVVPTDAVETTKIESSDALIVVVAGGSSRAESVRRGLAGVPADAQIVLVHDAARPLATKALFARVIEAVTHGAEAVVPVVELADTIRSVDGGVVDRSTLRAVQTPQGFRYDTLVDAHASGAEATDDASLAEAAGYTVTTVSGDPTNRKITDRADQYTAEALLRHLESSS